MSGFTPISWPTESQVTLCRVPWDFSYRDVVRFESPAARDTWFSGQVSNSITIGKMTYLKPNEPIMVNLPYSEAYTYNYVVVRNPELPVPGEATPPVLYYFVTSVAYVAPNTTALELQLDCFQTYCFSLEFGSCFVERGHVAMQAVINSTPDKNLANLHPKTVRKYLTAAEGLDIGNEYLVCNHEYIDLTYPDRNPMRVIIMSTTDLAAAWGTASAPSLTTADGQKIDGLISGCNVYSMTTTNFKLFMDKISDAPWVAKGIISMTAFPGALLTDGPDVTLGGVPAHFLGTTPDEGVYHTTSNVYTQLMNGIPNRYAARLWKFYTFPYTTIELTNHTGQSVILKPELLGDPTIQIKNISCAAPPHIRFGFFPANYGRNDINTVPPDISYSYSNMDWQGTGTMPASFYLDNCVWYQNMPQFAIVNDGFLTYMASSVHGREYSYQAAGWGLAKSNAGTQLTFDQAQATLANNQANQDINNIATVGHMAVNGVSSLASGNVGGAIGGVLNGGIDLVSGNMQFQNNQALQGQFASQNADLAKWAQRGDYETQIAGINATVQDAALTQPSQSGQAGGEGFNLANGIIGLEVRFKTLDPNHAAIIGEYWYRYGYAVREFLTPPNDLKCMTLFTYWKMSETYLIVANADEGVKDVIRGILEKGVTVWTSPDYIGRVDMANNSALPGVLY